MQRNAKLDTAKNLVVASFTEQEAKRLASIISRDSNILSELQQLVLRPRRRAKIPD